MESDEAGLIELGITLNQTLEDHVIDAADDEAIEIAAEHELLAGANIIDLLINHVRHVQHRRRRHADNIRQPQWASLAVFHFTDQFQRIIVKGQAETVAATVCRVDGVFQRQDLFPVHRCCRRNRGSFIHGSRQTFRLFRCTGAGTTDQVTRLTAADTLGDPAGKVGFHINRAILQQLVGHANYFGCQLQRAQAVHAEFGIFFAGFFVFAQQHTHLIRAVSRRPLHGSAVRGGQDLRHTGDAAIGFHLLNHFRQEGFWYGIPPLLIRRNALRAQLTQCLALFGGQLGRAVTHPFIKHGNALLRIFTFRVFILLLALLLFLLLDKRLIQRAQGLFPFDFLIDGLQLALSLLPLGALLIGPGVITNFVMQGAHVGGDGVSFLLQFMQFGRRHSFSLHIK